ncbi:DUF5610 domain-containing protein [Pseudoalteromonas sp. APC 3213]|uniref:DUF5610 domain-containing protein n=1 Tax=Pseudoalteromonas sp. APC 3213 TaxID=3035178 RepID=UPI0025B2FBB7|nr:DUF5610 domain-containing protein [Pseudoalteromonas sp. APC 3213]MDN3403439.1 DUF5610 domain-containing protein [Pseudoalteromonas sp. APC 3213]
MKIGNFSFVPNSNANKYNTKQAMPQPKIDSPPTSYQQRGKELAAAVLGDKMAKELGLPVAETKKDKPLFDFNEVVKNVLDFVTSSVNKAKANGANDEKLQDILSQARKGVQTGVDEAVDELKGMGVFNQELEEGIDKSKESIFSGLDKFEQNLFNPQPASVTVSQAQYVSLSNSADYTFTTAEGDEVSISFADAYQSQSSSRYQKTDDSQSFSTQFSESRELSFSMSVNGELNEDEQQAINDLMAELQDVSKTFFSGDLDKVFEQAQELSLGNEQLVAFSMDLRQSKTVAAIKEYEQIKPTSEKAIAETVAPFNDDLKSAYSKAQTLGLESQLSGIIQWLNQDQQEIDKLVDYTNTMFENLDKLNAATAKLGTE